MSKLFSDDVADVSEEIPHSTEVIGWYSSLSGSLSLDLRRSFLHSFLNYPCVLLCRPPPISTYLISDPNYFRLKV